MAYSPKVKAQARRLGVKLPTEAPDCTPKEWSSDGFDTLFEGPCMLTFGQGSWTVSLRRSSKRGGYRKVASGLRFNDAVELARFLRNPVNRRAYRGLRPKGQAAEVVEV